MCEKEPNPQQVASLSRKKRLYSQSAYTADDEISLREIVLVVWRGKWLIIGVTILSTAIAIAYAMVQTPEYRSEALLAPAQESGGNSGVPSGLGGLAGLAGIRLPSVSSSVDEAIALLESRAFTKAFIENQGIFPALYPELWDSEAQTWLLDEGQELPSENDAARKFGELRSVTRAANTGLVTVAIQWTDRKEAAAWVSALIDDINEEMRERAIEEAQKSKKFLEDELRRTSIVEVQQAIYGLMEEQVKKVMLANTRAQYAFKVLDPPTVSDKDRPVAPRSRLIVASGIALGGMLGLLAVFLRNAFRPQTGE